MNTIFADYCSFIELNFKTFNYRKDSLTDKGKLENRFLLSLVDYVKYFAGRYNKKIIRKFFSSNFRDLKNYLLLNKI